MVKESCVSTFQSSNDSPFFLIINLAIGGDWGGVQGVDNSIFPISRQLQFRLQ